MAKTIPELPPLAVTPAVDDLIIIYDTSSGTTRSITTAYLGTRFVSDTAYDEASWDGVETVAPSKNAVRDKIEAMISDTAYNPTSWDGVTTIAPSKNAVRDEIENIHTALNTKSLVLLDTITISSPTAAAAFTGLSDAYNEYEIHFQTVIPATDSAGLRIRTTDNGGISYDVGATHYQYGYILLNTSTGYAAANDTEHDGIVFAPSVGSEANEVGVSGIITIVEPGRAIFTTLNFSGSFFASNGFASRFIGIGVRNEAAIVDAVQFTFSTGDIELGKFQLYGVKHIQ